MNGAILKDYSTVIAVAILGLSLLIVAMIVGGAVRDLSDAIRQKPFPSPARIPDAITIRSGNDTFRVNVKNES